MKTLVRTLAACALVSAAAGAPFDAVDANFTAGVKAYESRNFGTAMDHLTQALLLSPSNAKIREYISLTQEGLEASEDVHRLDPVELQTMVKRAQEVLQRRRRQAAQTLNELKIASQESALQNPGALLEACRGIDIVVDVTLGDDSESLLIKHYVKSICAHLEKNAASRADAVAAQIRKIQGYLAFCRSDWRQAVNHWSQALTAAPEDRHLRLLLERAKRHLEKSLRNEDVARLLSAGDEAFALKQFERAEATFDAALSLDPYNQRALERLKISRRKAHDTLLAPISGWARQAAASQQSGDVVTAARHWLNILEIDPTDEPARRNLEKNRAALMNELHSTANTSADAAAPGADQARESKRLYTLGLIQYSQSRLAESRTSLSKAANLNPNDSSIKNALERVKNELSLAP